MQCSVLKSGENKHTRHPAKLLQFCCKRILFPSQKSCKHFCLHNRPKVSKILKRLSEIPLSLPLRDRASVHLAEHVQFLPKSQRIPEQPAEHPPRGFCLCLLRSLHSRPCSFQTPQSTAGNGPAFVLRYARQKIGPLSEERQWVNYSATGCKMNRSHPAFSFLIHKGWLGPTECFSELRRSYKSWIHIWLADGRSVSGTSKSPEWILQRTSGSKLLDSLQ